MPVKALHHIDLAIAVETREELDGVYQRCLEIDANVHFPPEEDRDIPGYWGLFVFDPDGMRIEVVYWPTDGAVDSV